MFSVVFVIISVPHTPAMVRYMAPQTHTCHISIMGVVGIVSCHSHCVYTKPHRHVNFQSFAIDQNNRSDGSDLVGVPSSKGLESYKVIQAAT